MPASPARFQPASIPHSVEAAAALPAPLLEDSVRPISVAAVAALAVTILGGPRDASAAAVVRGPFLQQTTPTSTLVALTTDAAAVVEATATLPGGASATARSQGTHHVLRLTGLPAASSVPYRVTVDGVELASAQFRTPGVPGTAAARRAVLGATADTGSAGPMAKAMVTGMIARGVEAVLTMGDNSYPDGAAGEWTDTFFGVWKPLMPHATMWTGIGDHEYRTPFAQPYLDAVELPAGPQGERYYSFDWGDVHVVALDTNCIVPVNAAEMGCDAKTMVAWLEQDLAASAAPWTIVTMHRPALATGKYGVYEEIPAALFGPFERHGVDLVLQAHNHLYERTWPARGGAVVKKDYDRPGAPVYVTAGGGSDYLYESTVPAAPWTAFRATAHQFLAITQDGGTLKVESVKPDGSILDAFTIVKDVPTPAAEEPPAVGGPGPAPEQWPPARQPEQPGLPARVPARLGGGCQSGAPGGVVAIALAFAVLAGARGRRKRP